MRNIIIYNDSSVEDSVRLSHVLMTRFLDNREYWFDFYKSLEPMALASTMEKFLSLANGDNLIFSFRFQDIHQVRIVIAMLYKLLKKKIKVNVYFVDIDLRRQFDKYILREDTEDASLRFINVIDYHNFYQVSLGEPDRMVKTSEKIGDLREGQEIMRRFLPAKSMFENHVLLQNISAF